MGIITGPPLIMKNHTPFMASLGQVSDLSQASPGPVSDKSQASLGLDQDILELAVTCSDLPWTSSSFLARLHGQVLDFFLETRVRHSFNHDKRRTDGFACLVLASLFGLDVGDAVGTVEPEWISDLRSFEQLFP